MKKILFTILVMLFASIGLYATDTYDSYTKAVYYFENNGNDYLGNYNLAQTGTPLFYTDNVKQGTFSLGFSISNYFTLSSSLISYLGTQSQWTIEMWFYVDTTTFWNRIFMGEWINDPDGIGLIIQASGGYGQFGYDGSYGNFTPSSFAAGWHFFSMQYDGSYAKVYCDGILQETFADGHNIFTDTTQTMYLMMGRYTDQDSTNTRMDKMVVSNIVRNGAETTPIPPTPTITPTYTWTLTPTNTPPYTPTITPIPALTLTPPVAGNRITGFRITFSNGLFVVSMIGDANFQEADFDYQLYLVAKPAGITITPLTQ